MKVMEINMTYKILIMPKAEGRFQVEEIIILSDIEAIAHGYLCDDCMCPNQWVYFNPQDGIISKSSF